MDQPSGGDRVGSNGLPWVKLKMSSHEVDRSSKSHRALDTIQKKEGGAAKQKVLRVRPKLIGPQVGEETLPGQLNALLDKPASWPDSPGRPGFMVP